MGYEVRETGEASAKRAFVKAVSALATADTGSVAYLEFPSGGKVAVRTNAQGGLDICLDGGDFAAMKSGVTAETFAAHLSREWFGEGA